jgi:hypothetical protein
MALPRRFGSCAERGVEEMATAERAMCAVICKMTFGVKKEMMEMQREVTF